MRITADQTIAEYPAVRVRQLMRETPRASVTLRHVRQVLRCSDSGAASVLNRLEKDGLIESVSGRLEPSTKGRALAMATAARPLRRTTATRLVAGLIERARAVNSDDSWAYRVWMVAVFGSYVRGAARRIWLNLELAKKPVQCIEYVMVHELAHLLERHHSNRFVAIMDRDLPPWRVLRAELNAAPLAHEDWSY